MAVSPSYTATPRTERGLLSVANTNRDGTGTIVNLFTAALTGSRVERITICATGTTTVGMIRFFITADNTNKDLYLETPVSAITPTSTNIAYYRQFSSLAIILASGDILSSSTNNAENFRVIVEGGDF